MKVGDLFRFQVCLSIHNDIDKSVGIVLSPPNRQGQYKVKVQHKTLWILRNNMVVISEGR